MIVRVVEQQCLLSPSVYRLWCSMPLFLFGRGHCFHFLGLRPCVGPARRCAFRRILTHVASLVIRFVLCLIFAEQYVRTSPAHYLQVYDDIININNNGAYSQVFLLTTVNYHVPGTLLYNFHSSCSGLDVDPISSLVANHDPSYILSSIYFPLLHLL